MVNVSNVRKEDYARVKTSEFHLTAHQFVDPKLLVQMEIPEKSQRLHKIHKVFIHLT